jgi:hypothetical protein
LLKQSASPKQAYPQAMKCGVTAAMATITMSVMAATGIAGADPGALRES